METSTGPPCHSFLNQGSFISFIDRWDAEIKPIYKCVSDSGNQAGFEAVMYGDHLMSKVCNNFDLSQ